jgi:hypothetical protein
VSGLWSYAALPPDDLRALAARLDGLGTLERVLAWGAGQHPPRPIAGVVTQDEFTHDVLLPIEPPLWLVFDVT